MSIQKRLSAFGVLLILPFLPLHAEEVQIFSNEERQENANVLILDMDDTGEDVRLQFGASLGESLFWDALMSQFVLTDDLWIQGIVRAGSMQIPLTHPDGTIDGGQISLDSINENALDFGSGAGQISGSDIPIEDHFFNANGANVQQVVEEVDLSIGSRVYTEEHYIQSGENISASLDALDKAVSNTTNSSMGSTTNVFVLDGDNSGGNIALQFGDQLSEKIFWDATALQFVITDDLHVEGDLSLSGTVNGVDLSTLQSDLTDHLAGSRNRHDTSDIDALSAGYNISPGTLQDNISALDQAIGDKNYTNPAYITNGQSVSDSLEALDAALSSGGVETFFLPINDLTIHKDGTQNTASLYTDSESGVNPHQYYLLKTTKTSLQDLTLRSKIRLPENFRDFSLTNDLGFFYKNTGFNATDSKIEIIIEDDEGDDAFPAVEGKDLFSANWTEYVQEFDEASFDPQAGEYLYITIQVFGSSDNTLPVKYQSPFAGELILRYTTD